MSIPWIIANEGVTIGDVERCLPKDTDLRSESSKQWYGFISPVLFALSLLRCNNVATIRHEVNDKANRKRTSQGLCVLKEHYSPEISRFKDVSEGLKEGGEGVNRDHKERLKQSLHLCRGHIKDYTGESSGLFGRIKGSFWWSDQVRGGGRKAKP